MVFQGIIVRSGKVVIFRGKCVFCRETNEVSTTEDEYLKYQDGAMVQDAFKYMSADDREFIISNICGPCFDEAFPDE